MDETEIKEEVIEEPEMQRAISSSGKKFSSHHSARRHIESEPRRRMRRKLDAERTVGHG